MIDLVNKVNLAWCRKSLKKSFFDYVQGGSGNETSLTRNLTCFDDYNIDTRVLVDTRNINLQTKVAKISLDSPIMVAPTAYHCLSHPDGEVGTAVGATKSNIQFCLSTMSNCSITDVAKESPNGFFFQVYLSKDPEANERILDSLNDTDNCIGVVVTVDVPVLGSRMRDIENEFSLPPDLGHPILDEFFPVPRDFVGSQLEYFVNKTFSDRLTWESLELVKRKSKVPVFLKGILNSEDAVIARDMGFDGVIVSNHGGRQLDGSPSPLDVIEEIRSAVGDKYCLMMDGGVRTGRDVFKAIALGADAVLVGRPVIWALARQGAGGVTEFFQELKRDLVNTMKLAGVRRIQDIQRSKVSKK